MHCAADSSPSLTSKKGGCREDSYSRRRARLLRIHDGHGSD
jgi:hypothetical protein